MTFCRAFALFFGCIGNCCFVVAGRGIEFFFWGFWISLVSRRDRWGDILFFLGVLFVLLLVSWVFSWIFGCRFNLSFFSVV